MMHSLLRFFLLVSIGFLSCVNIASAQYGEGVRGWCTVTRSSGEACYGDPLSACFRQYQEYADPRDAFEGAYPYGIVTRQCDWLYRGEGGHSLILPALVTFRCQTGYNFEPPDRCVQYRQKERQICQGAGGGSPNPTGDTNPILLSSGAKNQTEQDYIAADNRFDITRYYRSRSAGNATEYNADPLGVGMNWRLSFEYEIHLDDFGNRFSNTTSIHMPDGSAFDFTRQANGTMAPAGGDASQIPVRLAFADQWPADPGTIINAPTHWQITLPDNRVITLVTFRAPFRSKYTIARPTSIVDHNGYQLNFTYDAIGALSAITDSFNQTINVSWFVQDPSTYGGTSGIIIPRAISRIDLPDNTAIRYSYDTPTTIVSPVVFPDRLVRVEYLDSADVVVGSKQYLYEDSRFAYALTGVIDERGVRIESWQYDARGRAIVSEGAGGTNRYTVSYTDTANSATRTVTNPLGKSATYQFTRTSDIVRLQTVTGQPSAHCIGTTRSYQYNPQGFLTATIDANGNQTRYLYGDALGRVTSITEGASTPAQRVTTIAWDPQWWLPSVITTPLLRKNFTYNATGQLIQRSEADLASNETREWAYTYAPGGLLESIDGPLSGSSDTVHLGYNSAGYLDEITDEVNQTVQVPAINGRGQPLSIIDRNGVQTNLEYDARGRVTTITFDALGNPAEWTLNYNRSGDLTGIQRPDGTFAGYSYDDARRWREFRDSADQSLELVYNQLGNLAGAFAKDSSGKLQAYFKQSFDELGRLLSYIGGAQQKWTLGYDAEGNQNSILNPRGHSITSTYNSLNQLIGYRDENGQQTVFTRTPAGAVSTVVDPRGVTTTYTRNGWGEILAETDLDAGTTTFTRSARGEPVESIDGRGVQSFATFDSAGRIQSQTFQGHSDDAVQYSYDDITNGNNGVGRLTRAENSASTISLYYDRKGQVTNETHRIGATLLAVDYEYDAAGHVVQMRYPSGRIVHFTFDRSGEISEIETETTNPQSRLPILTAMARKPFGPPTELQWGNNSIEHREYDYDYRLSALSIVNANNVIFERTYTYDGINLIAVEDPTNNSKAEKYNYTPTNWLSYADGEWGSTDISYDYSGNRVTQSLLFPDNSRVAEAYTIASQSNRLQSVANPAVRSFTYDGGGNIVADARNGLAKEYLYNGPGQLETVKISGVVVGTYRYNPRNQLVMRTANGSTTLYVYDLDGHLIAETDSQGRALREYIWRNDQPVALLYRNAAQNPMTLYFIHTDHLNRPVRLVNQQGVVQWSAAYQPWGQASISGDETILDLRFPGQWSQSESGLNYNWHRQYDPTIGRYTQPDPIGLNGGANRYSYVTSNPIMNIDPTGLCGLPCAGAAIEAIVFGINWYVQTAEQQRFFDELSRELNAPPKAQPSCTEDNPSGRLPDRLLPGNQEGLKPDFEELPNGPKTERPKGYSYPASPHPWQRYQRFGRGR